MSSPEPPSSHEALFESALAALAATGTVPQALRAALLALSLEDRAQVAEPPRPYGRRILHASTQGEVMLAAWRHGACAAPHDHGGGQGVVLPLRGRFEERSYCIDPLAGSLGEAGEPRTLSRGEALEVAPHTVHDMASLDDEGLTLHLYAGTLGPMRVYDLAARITWETHGGAWLPVDDSVKSHPWGPAATEPGVMAPAATEPGVMGPAATEPGATATSAPRGAPQAIWIGYTTLYRDGGAKFRRVALTLERDLARTHPGLTVVAEAVECKADFVAAMERVRARGQLLRALHFVGHSGMYGPMFRTTQIPEQFSPHEWRTLRLPFAPDGEAYFHCCRSARWFAPFFARTHGVPASGYHLYTTFSRRPERFAWDPPTARSDDPLYVVALPGRKSHGLGASLLKYSHLLPTERLRRFEPEATQPDTSYDSVAALYDEAFADISVRGPEVAFVERHLPAGSPRVVELGCGNGALLARLAPRLASGLGLDASPGMIDRARARFGHVAGLRFESLSGPQLPVEDASVDVVVSMLSWRYLDWDPIMAEIRRVLAPGGRLLVVDMVASPLSPGDAPRLLQSALQAARQRLDHATFHARLRRLVSDPRWQRMLAYNPIRAEHEYRWYFEGRFPGRKVEVLTVALSSRVVAFDSGPLPRGFTLPQSYP
jgi:SAM-dependent methyltransferase